MERAETVVNPKRASISHGQALVSELRADPLLAVEYIKASMEDAQDDPAVLLLALRHVAEAFGMQDVAKAAGIQRASLYRALSPTGNPTFKTLCAVLETVGLRLSVEPRHSNMPE